MEIRFTVLPDGRYELDAPGVYPLVMDAQTFANYPARALRRLFEVLPRFVLAHFAKGETLPLWGRYVEDGEGRTIIAIGELPPVRLRLDAER